jgi:carboxymethylenebutenolidase
MPLRDDHVTDAARIAVDANARERADQTDRSRGVFHSPYGKPAARAARCSRLLLMAHWAPAAGRSPANDCPPDLRLHRYARRENVSVTSRWIDIPTGNDSFGAYMSTPKSGKGPAVIIIQEIFGVNGHIRDVVDQYAQDGYIAIAPDIFWRTQPRVELTYAGADRDKGIEILQKTNVDLAVADIGATAAALRAMPDVTGKIAGVGYCFGGRLAYLAAAEGLLDIAVSYYGGGIQNALDKAPQIKIPLQFHYGELDHGIPLSAVGEVKERFAGRDDAELYIYPNADHGFNCTERASYHQHSAALAHGRTLTFLGTHA